MRAATLFTGLLCMLFSNFAMAAYQLDMKPGVTTFSQGAYSIHHTVMIICLVIGIIVFGALIYSIINHTKAKGAIPADFDDNVKVELAWTIIPTLVLIAIAIPATKVLLEAEDVSNSDMSVKVTGYQWKWHYDYVGEDVGFFSNITTPDSLAKSTSANVKKTITYLRDVDNRLVVPVNKKVRLLFTSNDVIHSWWVPAFGVKKDAIPGYINESWIKTDKIGTYRGQCAELCGTNHAFMPIVVDVVSQADYATWLDSQKAAAADAVASSNKTWTMDDLMSRGKTVFSTNCAACHQASGEGIPGAFPALKGSPITTGEIAKHIHVVLEGRSGTAMQAFGTQMNDADLAAVITYERNAWGNNTGDAVQPSDIKSARK